MTISQISLILLFIIIIAVFVILILQVIPDIRHIYGGIQHIYDGGYADINIIHISGMQGSGKSYINDKLKDTNYTVVELDDVMVEAYYNIRDLPEYIRELHNSEAINDMLNIEEDRILSLIIDNSIANNKRNIVLLGMTTTVSNKYSFYPYTTKRYYLMAHDELEVENWFRRAVKRDYKKLISKPDEILDIIEKSSVYNMNDEIGMSRGGIGLIIPASFDYYLNTYKRRFVNSNAEGVFQDVLIARLLADDSAL
jgi:adenylate kinase family enzyme